MARASIVLMLLLAAACSRQPPEANRSGNRGAPADQRVPKPANSSTPAAAPVTEEQAVDEAGEEGDVAAETPAPAPRAQGCAGEIGGAAARRLVRQCLEVSPATHPPCNVANSCEMIQDEIDRGCGMLGNDAPDFCPNPPPD